MRNSSSLIFAALLLAAPLVSQAGNGEAIVGSIIGGATGAIIGNNVGGRDGAIVGGAIGAAAGVAIATDNNGNRRYDDHRYDDRRGRDGYYNAHDDYRYRNDYNRYDRYDRRYDRYDNDRRREVVVVESPRYYYQGNDFVYGVPSYYDNGRHRGWERNRHRDRGPDVIVIQPAPRRW